MIVLPCANTLPVGADGGAAVGGTAVGGTGVDVGSGVTVGVSVGRGVEVEVLVDVEVAVLVAVGVFVGDEPPITPQPEPSAPNSTSDSTPSVTKHCVRRGTEAV